MEVFFDDDGIQNALKQFNPEDLKDLPIDKDWRARKVEYINSLNKVLEDMHHPFRFDTTKGVVRSKGENHFEIKKVDMWGWQKYHIESGKGSLIHVYEPPGHASQTISSTFELLETDSNNVQLSFSEIYLYWKKVIKPEYKQIFSKTQSDTFYSHNLVSLTKVRFFPYVDIGETVYLLRQSSNGTYIPVGYAIYYPD